MHEHWSPHDNSKIKTTLNVAIRKKIIFSIYFKNTFSLSQSFAKGKSYCSNNDCYKNINNKNDDFVYVCFCFRCICLHFWCRIRSFRIIQTHLKSGGITNSAMNKKESSVFTEIKLTFIRNKILKFERVFWLHFHCFRG